MVQLLAQIGCILNSKLSQIFRKSSRSTEKIESGFPGSYNSANINFVFILRKCVGIYKEY